MFTMISDTGYQNTCTAKEAANLINACDVEHSGMSRGRLAFYLILPESRASVTVFGPAMMRKEDALSMLRDNGYRA